MGGFIEGSLAEAKLIGDEVFPKTLLPAAASKVDLAKSVVAEREFLVATLRRHRALLFRGFKVTSMEDFERVVEAFDWEPYQMILGTTTRSKLSERIYTANEASTDLFINFHHELPLRPKVPSKIFFYCIQPSPEGGETSIVASDVIVEKMEERMPDFMAKVKEVGLIHGNKTATDAEVGTQSIFNRSWKASLGSDDEVEAEKRAKETLSCSAVNFFSDGSAELVFGPLNPVVEREGKRAWIIPIHGYTDDKDMASNKFGDGNAFPSEVFGIYEQLLEENCVDIKWQKGDVLLLDNYVVQHARRPGKPPRRLLTSICN
ncbi:clavaminate synthase-like protein At3g21360 [Phalaenopsis equestris]|uniref:clavaminate synthase-like protein At3g21360 n=1 Tax=Phalaenopsis equestris TaxID=78828 RepID=UPI0009E3946F|nr:clavaminate synthase-like protein At3g21360 [Phalaenopsis equestris]